MKTLSIVLGLGLFATLAMGEVDQRLQNQDQRIENGVKSGALNSNEAARLEAGQKRVKNAEAKAKADGTVTKQEARKLNRMQNRQSRKIKRLKNNNR